MCIALYRVAVTFGAAEKYYIWASYFGFCRFVFLKFVGVSIFTIALSVGCAIALMQVFKCVHPPAGANPLVILLTASSIHYEWSFLIFPVLVGAVSLVLVAMLINNIKASTKWPMYGLGILNSKK